MTSWGKGASIDTTQLKQQLNRSQKKEGLDDDPVKLIEWEENIQDRDYWKTVTKNLSCELI